MEPASHIFEWTYNSQALNTRMHELRGRTKKITQTAVAMDALLIANSAVREMIHGGEINQDEYGAVDILQAARLIVGWTGEA